MSLQSLIENGNYASAQAAYDAITTPVETQNSKAWTVADLTKEFPPTESNDLNTMLGTMETVPVFRSAFIALSITGLEFASTERQQLIDTLSVVGQWSQELTSKVKRLGRPIKAPWEVDGLSQAPTLQQVTDAWTAWKAETDLSNLRQSLRVRFDSILNQVGTVEQADAIAELRTIANELEA